MNRAEYMKRSQEPGVHREYYAQFVTPTVTNAVLRSIGLERIVKSDDLNMNDIPLHLWDRIIGFRDGRQLDDDLGCAPALRAAGEPVSCGTLVCIMKEAARQIKEGIPAADWELPK